MINNIKSFTEEFPHLLAMTGTKTQTEFAKFLGISQASVASAKKKNRIPKTWYMRIEEVKTSNENLLKPYYEVMARKFIEAIAPPKLVKAIRTSLSFEDFIFRESDTAGEMFRHVLPDGLAAGMVEHLASKKGKNV